MADLFRLPNLNPQTCGTINHETIGRLRELGDTYLAALDVAREIRLELDQELRAASAAGHSFEQLSEVSGLSIGTIQNIQRAVSVEKLH